MVYINSLLYKLVLLSKEVKQLKIIYKFRVPVQAIGMLSLAICGLITSQKSFLYSDVLLQ